MSQIRDTDGNFVEFPTISPETGKISSDVVPDGGEQMDALEARTAAVSASATYPFAATNDDGAGFYVRSNGQIRLRTSSGPDAIKIEADDTVYLGTGATVAVTPDGWLMVESLGQDPDDVDILGWSMIVYFDRTGAAPKLKIRARADNNNIYVGEIPLTPA